MFHPDFQAIAEAGENNLMYHGLYQMDELMEKLKLLNYERNLLKDMKMKPLSRFYFAKSKNPGEQFFLFTSICAWLIRKTGRVFEQPEEFHDPSKTIGNIVQILNEMDISTDFPTNKLMQGAGFICVYVMDCLATQAIKVNSAHLQRPEVNTEEDVVDEIIANENEIILEKLEEEQMAMMHSDDDSDDGFGGGGIMHNNLLDLKKLNNKNDLNSKRYMINNNNNQFSGGENTNALMVDSENWRLELERVLPQLKVVVKTDPRDWRAHWEQMKTLRANINSTSVQTLTQLKKLRNDISFAFEKIESREKHLNNELANLILQYKNISMEYAQVQSSMKEVVDEKESLEQKLEKTVSDFENVKIQMEQRGNTMSDGSPLINIKKAIVKIKEEIVEMDLSIGVMKHSIDQDILKQNAIYAELEPSISVF